MDDPFLKTPAPYRLPAPRRYLSRGDLHPLMIDGLERQGYDVAAFLEHVNESTHRRRQATVLAEAEAIIHE